MENVLSEKTWAVSSVPLLPCNQLWWKGPRTTHHTGCCLRCHPASAVGVLGSALAPDRHKWSSSASRSWQERKLIADMGDQALLSQNVPEHRVDTVLGRTQGKERRLWACRMPFVVEAGAESLPGLEGALPKMRISRYEAFS